MGQALVPGLEITRSARIRRKRELPIKGKTLVRVGDLVKSSQIVASAELPGDMRILRIPEKLGIEPFEVIKLLAERGIKEGVQVKTDEIICEHSGLFGLFRSRYLSPATGKVEFVSETNAHVGIREPSRELKIDAYISGKVVEVDDGQSVTIENDAAFVQGIFGVGGERRGEIALLKCSPSTALTEKDIPENVRGKIIIGGMRPNIAAIRRAAELGACALVTGSLDDQALKGYLGYELGVALTGDEELPMTLIITEGFGELPISEKVLGVLSQFEGKEASVNGATQVRAGALRPELIVPHPTVSVSRESSTDLASKGLVIGSKVRIIRVPYFGRKGEVTALPHEPALIESGAFCRVVKVKIDGMGEVIVPRANVEIT